MSDTQNQLDQLVSAVLKSSKYKNVCEELVRYIGTRELSIHRTTKKAIKTTKNKLHQIGGAYFETRIDYTRGLEELVQANASGNNRDLRQVCKKLMSLHISTKERNEILEEFYSTMLVGIQPIRVVLDIACGLNPLAIPWMSLDENVIYYAYDIYLDMIDFIQEFIAMIGVQGQAQACNVIQSPPTQQADLALILKTIPCLEQLDKAAGLRLLETINANHLLISFPVHSLSGRSKGMIKNYETRFRELVQGKPWGIQRFEFATELAFLVTKGRMHTRYDE